METKDKNKAKKTQEPLKTHGDKMQSPTQAEETYKKQQEPEEQNTENKEKQKDFWEDAKENVSEGAKAVGDTVNEYAQSIKERAKEAFKSSSVFTMEMVHNAQEIIDTYKHKYEIKRLSDERDTFLAKLGKHVYHTVKSIDDEMPKNYLEETEVQTLIREIENIDKKIIDLNEHENNK